MLLRRSALALTATAGIAVSAAMAMPAAATASPSAYPTTTVNIAYGASTITGTLTWYDRSVGFSGNLKAVGCRRAWYSAYEGSTSLGARSSSTHCDTTVAVPVTLPADVVGGGTDVLVCIHDANAVVLKCMDYPRP